MCIDLLLGMVLVAGGVLVALAIGGDEPLSATVEQAVVEAVAEEVGLPVEDTGLLADETEVALTAGMRVMPGHPEMERLEREMLSAVRG